MPKTVGCSIVRVGYSILRGISLITGENGINAYDVMNFIEAGTPVCDRILFSLAVEYTHKLMRPPCKKKQQQQQQRQRNNHSLLVYTTQDSLVLPMLNQSICDRRFTSN